MRAVRAGVMVAFLFAAASAILGLFLCFAGPRGVIGLRHRH
jgi:hypothetical protein